MTGHRAGDNSQVLALAEGLESQLGWPFEIKRFVYRKTELASNLLLGPNLVGVVKGVSSTLEPPWPDLILTAGRRNEPICRWIQRQAAGQRVRLVHVGRTWAAIGRFDLIVTTPQYRLPDLPNILHNETPLHRIHDDRLEAQATAWRPRFAHLPEPHIAVIMGGNSGPYTFDPAAGARLARQASAFAKARGGSLLVTTSARTPPEALAAFEQALDAPAYLYRWSAKAKENPYFAFLALADELIVTGDSMSMLAEACATRKPVHIFDLGEGKYAMRPLRNGADRDGTGQGGSESERRSRAGWQRDYLRAFIFRMAMKVPPKRMTRDIRIVHGKLIETGRAVWLGDPFPKAAPPPLESVDRAVAAVAALFDGELGSPPVAPESPADAGRKAG
ncbi:mitochondrial fission ELM1 family protein [Algihabitans albus]|uniref:mitochondrial fission ELM1 family protein n=1 Tax=Algihabitans albus TaxID=2164067 RepID=UPI000E5C99AF|nr:mitochondrial fission ELM1 family protein [Algihabitans albus]